MKERAKVAGMRACIADHEKGRAYVEEMNGSWKLWRDLSVPGKLAYLAGEAGL